MQVFLVAKRVNPLGSEGHEHRHYPPVNNGLRQEHEGKERQKGLIQLREAVGPRRHQQAGDQIAGGDADEAGGEEAIDEDIDEKMPGQIGTDKDQEDLGQGDGDDATNQGVDRERLPANPGVEADPRQGQAGADDGEGPAEHEGERRQPQQVEAEPRLDQDLAMPEQDQHQDAAEEDVNQARGVEAPPGGQAQGVAQRQEIARQEKAVEERRQQAAVDDHCRAPETGLLAIIAAIIYQHQRFYPLPSGNYCTRPARETPCENVH